MSAQTKAAPAPAPTPTVEISPPDLHLGESSAPCSPPVFPSGAQGYDPVTATQEAAVESPSEPPDEPVNKPEIQEAPVPSKALPKDAGSASIDASSNGPSGLWYGGASVIISEADKEIIVKAIYFGGWKTAVEALSKYAPGCEESSISAIEVDNLKHLNKCKSFDTYISIIISIIISVLIIFTLGYLLFYLAEMIDKNSPRLPSTNKESLSDKGIEAAISGGMLAIIVLTPVLLHKLIKIKIKAISIKYLIANINWENALLLTRQAIKK